MSHHWFNERLLLILTVIIIATFGVFAIIPGLRDYFSFISALSFSCVGATALALGCIGFFTTRRQGF